MNLDQYSNTDIAEKIAKIMGYDYERSGEWINVTVRKSEDNVVSLSANFDPCNVAGDADAVIERFKINAIFQNANNKWCTYMHSNIALVIENESRLKSAMLCVIFNQNESGESL